MNGSTRPEIQSDIAFVRLGFHLHKSKKVVLERQPVLIQARDSFRDPLHLQGIFIALLSMVAQTALEWRNHISWKKQFVVHEISNLLACPSIDSFLHHGQIPSFHIEFSVGAALNKIKTA